MIIKYVRVVLAVGGGGQEEDVSSVLSMVFVVEGGEEDCRVLLVAGS